MDKRQWKALALDFGYFICFPGLEAGEGGDKSGVEENVTVKIPVD